MKRVIVFTTVISGIVLSVQANSQIVPPEPPALDPSRVARASEVPHSGFVDPGNRQAALFAKERGISVGEATSLLKRQAALNMFVERLKQRYPDKFSFVSVRGNEIVVGLTDPTVDIQSLLPPGLVNVKPIQAVYSEQGTYSKLDDLRRQLSAAGLRKVSVGVNAETGRVEFLTKTARAALENAIKSGSIKVDQGYAIIDDEIVATAALYGGHAYNLNPSYCTLECGGTIGFSLISSATSARYISTAAHVDNGPGRYNTSNSSTYASGGTSIDSPTDMFNYQLDVEYAPPSDAVNNPPYPYFWDGTVYVTVTNYTYPTQGATFCKYGRKTGKTCGVHDTVTVYSNPDWGVSYLRRILNNGSGINFNDEGDSGGPVYYGNWAAGWVHGHDGSYNMYYTPVADFKNLQTAIDLIVYR
jgi:hypothetical protein